MQMQKDKTVGRVHQPAATLFDSSIEILMEATARMPSGWQDTYSQAIGALRAMSCHGRRDLFIAGPDIENGEIEFEVSRDDSCVQGLLRKTAARLRVQCQLCGRPGKMRLHGFVRRPLCAKCEAPRALQRQLKRLLRKLAVKTPTKAVFGEHELSPLLRTLIPNSAWDDLPDVRGRATARYVATEDL